MNFRFVIFLVLTASISFAQELTDLSLAGFVYNSQSRIPFSLEAKLVQFELGVHKLRYYGADGGEPRFICRSLSIALGNQEIAIPEKAFSDLGDIASISPPFDSENGTWTVTIIGGDAGGSYRVDLIFNNRRLLERKFLDMFSAPEKREYYNVTKY